MAEPNRILGITLWVLFLWSLNAIAGPLFPLVNAVTSRNGNSVVVIEYRYDNPNAVRKRIQGATFRVARKTSFASFPNLFASASTYWSEVWSVTKRREIHVPLPLVTDNGQYLILLTNSAPNSHDMEVLSIYRENPQTHAAEVVGVCRLSDVWPANKLPPNPVVVTDHTPRWFDGGSFDFTSGYVFHKTRWGNAVQIQLIDKGVTNDCPLSHR
jgi:hypothetical protein